ncbi:acyltransferase family protein [Mycolicibacterium sediminis]|uniref:Acyltransferase n=1 Tax=Mycolicibacterium sediminis TaxID=1286180 RepID=A0A7I7QZE9_9MYCO|nr:acyltransferase [Mycolicibacterium sediminis]BBY31347.1 acyltransferase [Mycolicibacterium sediminis]
MASALLKAFPTAAEIDGQTPAGRDRTIDVIRIVALLGVVAGHTVMATSIIADGVFHWDNLLTTSVVFQALTWVFQIMPLFFFAGVAASVESYRGNWGGWLLKRCSRLYRPVFSYLAFWAVALIVLRHVLPVHVYEPVAGISIQLLWFLGAYVLVLAAVPLLARITSVPRLMVAMGGTYLLIAAVDHLRIGGDVPAIVAYVNLVAWLIPGMLGVAYRRGLLSPRQGVVLGAAALAVNLALLWMGPYELSLVGIESQQLKNMSPPSLLMAGHAIMLCAFAIGCAPAISRWARRPRVWRLAVIGNTGAMTLYLWHMPVLLGVHLVFDGLGLPRYPGQPHFLVLSVVQLAVVLALVAAAFLVLRPLENTPLPLWDGGVVVRPGPRSVLVGTLLCVAGAATLASVAWGLKDQGVYCVSVMLVALVAARVIARPTVRTAV